MAIPEITPSFSTPITGVGDLIIDPPSDPTSLGGGFDAGNLILGGEANVIQDSRRCTIINGASNFLEGKYNTHIIGDAVTPLSPFGPSNSIGVSNILNNAFYVGCFNGLHVNGDVVAFTSSDERLKDDITLIENPLNKVLSLDAVDFNWNDNQEVYSGHDIGLIAQQVEEVAPEIVTTRENGFKAVKYDRVTSLLVGAIKEQQKIIESLEERISKLENQTQ